MKSEGAAITRMLTLLGAALSVVVAGASQGTSHRPDVRFLPTPDNVVDAMLELAHVTASDIVFDLGSGDGRIPIAAAKKYGARAVGIEIDEQLVRLSRENAGEGRRHRSRHFCSRRSLSVRHLASKRRDALSAAVTQYAAHSEIQAGASPRRSNCVAPFRHGRRLAAGCRAGYFRVDDLSVGDSINTVP